MKDGKKIAVVPGSFDPITFGHIDIVKRAAQSYDRVYLAVMINDQKKYMLDIEQRELIAKLALSDIENVEVVSSRGMLWKLAEDLCADAIVKGYRNSTDYEYEMTMAEFNLEHNPNAPTVLLKADEALEKLSSTIVRERIANGEALDGYLPQSVIPKLEKFITDNKNKA